MRETAGFWKKTGSILNSAGFSTGKNGHPKTGPDPRGK
jgi:hypothetical protein